MTCGWCKPVHMHAFALGCNAVKNIKDGGGWLINQFSGLYIAGQLGADSYLLGLILDQGANTTAKSAGEVAGMGEGAHA